VNKKAAEKRLSPAQAAIVEQVKQRGASFMGWSTDPKKNTVHAPSAERLVGKGVLSEHSDPSGQGRRVVRLAGSDVTPTRPIVPPPPATGARGQRSAVQRRRAEERRKAKPSPPPSAEPVPETEDAYGTEPESVRKARSRIRSLVRSVVQGQHVQAIQLVLALVNQETGNHKAANVLITEYKLDEIFGIQRF